MNKLNLGCGNRYHPDWINVDFYAHPPDVIGANLGEGIPSDSENCEVIYHSHVLEHFAVDAAQRFLNECYRVLTPGGIMRVVIPDLEEITRKYIEKMEIAISGDTVAEADYDWMMLELYDQTVRIQSGGKMKNYLEDTNIVNREFVSQRMGWFKPLVRLDTSNKQRTPVRSAKWKRLFRLSSYREKILRVILGSEYSTLQEGRFRRSGEIHQWMYDRFSLGRILEAEGFDDVRVCAADESLIPQWNNYFLDIEQDGSVRKPDSLFMECKKPK